MKLSPHHSLVSTSTDIGYHPLVCSGMPPLMTLVINIKCVAYHPFLEDYVGHKDSLHLLGIDMHIPFLTLSLPGHLIPPDVPSSQSVIEKKRWMGATTEELQQVSYNPPTTT